MYGCYVSSVVSFKALIILFVLVLQCVLVARVSLLSTLCAGLCCYLYTQKRRERRIEHVESQTNNVALNTIYRERRNAELHEKRSKQLDRYHVMVIRQERFFNTPHHSVASLTVSPSNCYRIARKYKIGGKSGDQNRRR